MHGNSPSTTSCNVLMYKARISVSHTANVLLYSHSVVRLNNLNSRPQDRGKCPLPLFPDLGMELQVLGAGIDLRFPCPF